MKLTVAHLLDLIDSLPKSVDFDYVKPGKNKARLISVDKNMYRVEMARIDIATQSATSSFLTEDNLQKLADSIVENQPFSIDKIFNNGGNTRSVWEAIIANTTEFYKCMVGKNKNLVWMPTLQHEIGKIVEKNITEIPVSNTADNVNRESVKEEFRFFLSECVKSTRGTEKTEGGLGETAVHSYINSLETNKNGVIPLFDYAPDKWQHINDIYGITDPIIAEEIRDILLSDEEFIKKDKGTSAYWRSGAISYYVLFLRARTYFAKNIINKTPRKIAISSYSIAQNSYLPYLTALRTKPFMLLAGISGTGKSRIVREMAKACWANYEEDYGKNCPRNFCMVQVKPNWHDSSELIGYVSRINGEKYVVGPFLRFIAQALKEPQRPYFLCLDEMNLAPVEQYFAEYLSVVESRKLQDGHIVTDPIVPFENTEAYGNLIDQLFESDEERKAYKTEEGGKRLTIPENLFVVGTVNMDETTFSFSRKVLDRAMTIEMNEVNLSAGLDDKSAGEMGYIGSDLIGKAAEGCDIYADNQALCDEVIAYLEKVNEVLDGTPFKIAYRTRNEFLLYAVNRSFFASDTQLWQILDEMTSMKILSRIEGDSERCEKPLRGLEALLKEAVGEHAAESVSLRKIEEMTRKLQAGYTSYWT